MISRARRKPVAFQKGSVYPLWPLVTHYVQTLGNLLFLPWITMKWASSSASVPRSTLPQGDKGQLTSQCCEGQAVKTCSSLCFGPVLRLSTWKATKEQCCACNCLCLAPLPLPLLSSLLAACRLGTFHFILRECSWWLLLVWDRQSTSVKGPKQNSSCSPKSSLLLFPLGYSLLLCNSESNKKQRIPSSS